MKKPSLWNCNHFGKRNVKKSRSRTNRNWNVVKNAMMSFLPLFVVCTKILCLDYCPNDSTSSWWHSMIASKQNWNRRWKRWNPKLPKISQVLLIFNISFRWFVSAKIQQKSPIQCLTNLSIKSLFMKPRVQAMPAHKRLTFISTMSAKSILLIPRKNLPNWKRRRSRKNGSAWKSSANVKKPIEKSEKQR